MGRGRSQGDPRDPRLLSDSGCNASSVGGVDFASAVKTNTRGAGESDDVLRLGCWDVPARASASRNTLDLNMTITPRDRQRSAILILTEGLRPSDTRSRAPLRRRAPIAWLTRTTRSHLEPAFGLCETASIVADRA